MDDWCLRFPGIQDVQHVCFYAVHGADEATLRRYLETAYRLGKEFDAVSSRKPAEANV